MPDGVARVTDYEVDIRMLPTESSGSLGVQKRIIRLKVVRESGDEITDALIQVLQGPLPVPPGKVEGGRLVAFQPLSDFRDIYQVLRTESPVFLEFFADADGSLRKLALRTKSGTFAEDKGEIPGE